MANLSNKYLRIADLRRLRHLFFSSRRPVEGLYAGRHASPQRGHSVEFSDYRTYMPGDEIADIDWKVFARSDRLFVKLFEHQSDMTVHLLVDASASMNYPFKKAQGPKPKVQSRGAGAESLQTLDLGLRTLDSKYDHACRIAASIAFLATKQQDKVSFAVARHGLRHFHRPAGAMKSLFGLLKTMEQVHLGEQSGLAVAIDHLTARVPRRGLLVLFSDLLEEPQPILQALSTFTQRGGEAIVFHVLHADELDLPALGDAVFTDSESAARVTISVDDVRPAYQQKMRGFLDAWSGSLRGRGIDYQLVSTATPYEKALERYLFARAAR
jgi:uncharacterized protein (DUF58 family)